MFDLLIKNANIYEADMTVRENMDVAVAGRKIAAVQPGINAAAAQTVDAGGRLLTPSFIDVHMHIDESFTMDDDDTLSIIAACNNQDKCNFKYFDYSYQDVLSLILRNAGRVVRMCAANGTMLLKTNVLFLPAWGTAALEAMVILRKDLSHLCEIRTCCGFPPAFEETIRAYASQGYVDYVSGYPYMDEDYQKSIDRIFRFAQEYDLPVDAHIGESDVPDIRCLLYFLYKVEENHYEGRVSCGHLTALAAHGIDPAAAHDAIIKAGKCRLNVATLTSCNLYLMSPNRRGPTCIRALQDAGCNISIGSDNIRDTFRPWGNCDLLEEALLTAKVQHFCSNKELRQVFHMITYNAAKNAGVGEYGVRQGCNANLVLLDAENPEETIIDQVKKKYVWKDGRQIAKNGILTQV